MGQNVFSDLLGVDQVASTLENGIASVNKDLAVQLGLLLHLVENLKENQAVSLEWVFLENWWAIVKLSLLFKIWIWFWLIKGLLNLWWELF